LGLCVMGKLLDAGAWAKQDKAPFHGAFSEIFRSIHDRAARSMHSLTKLTKALADDGTP
jgi:hypothetical protein